MAIGRIFNKGSLGKDVGVKLGMSTLVKVSW